MPIKSVRLLVLKTKKKTKKSHYSLHFLRKRRLKTQEQSKIISGFKQGKSIASKMVNLWLSKAFKKTFASTELKTVKKLTCATRNRGQKTTLPATR